MVFVPDVYTEHAGFVEEPNDNVLLIPETEPGSPSAPVGLARQSVVLYRTNLDFWHQASRLVQLTPEHDLLPGQTYHIDLAPDASGTNRLSAPYTMGIFATGTGTDSTAPTRLDVVSVELGEGDAEASGGGTVDVVDEVVLKLRNPIPERSIAIGWLGPVNQPIEFGAHPQIAILMEKGKQEIRLPYQLTECLPFRIGLTIADESANYSPPIDVEIPLTAGPQPKQRRRAPFY